MAETIVVVSGDQTYFTVNYYDDNDPVKRTDLENKWKIFNRYDPALRQTYEIWCRPTNPNLEVEVDHLMPQNVFPGKYRVEIFVPAVHAETRQAIFNVTHSVSYVNGGEKEETTMAVVDMSEINDVWHPLGEFFLDPSIHPSIGKVRQYDLSREDPSVMATYGPVRWVPLFSTSGKRNRFDSPVGTKDERNGVFPTGRVAYGRYPIWAGQWFDFNPFLTWYIYGYHTGADLNLPGTSGADQGKEIYSIAEGIVTYAGRAGSWGNIIVVKHPAAKVALPEGKFQNLPVYSRYGHVDDQIQVRVGQEIKRGQLVGFIGLPANQISGWHLHFDICYTDLLKRRPAHWPNMDTINSLRYAGDRRDTRAYKSSQAAIMREVLNNYIDPLLFIRENHD